MNKLAPGYYRSLDEGGPLHQATMSDKGLVALCGSPVGRQTPRGTRRICLWCWRQTLLNELSMVDRMIEEGART